MTIEDATKIVRRVVRDIRVAEDEKRANDLESAVQLLVLHAAEDARLAALSTAARVVEALR